MRVKWLVPLGLIILSLGLIELAYRFHVQTDLSYNGRNSLSQASQRILAHMPGSIEITAYATEQDPHLGNLRRIISQFVALYQQAKPDIHLVFVDPRQAPQQAVTEGVEFNGELVIRYQQRKEKLTSINEQALTNALLRLSQTQHLQIMAVDGHGERHFDGMANYDLGLLGQKLRERGFQLANLNLVAAPAVPNNASLLVITQPRVDWLPGELEKIQRYITEGGNLLWLLDQGDLHGLERLGDSLNLVLNPQSIIDPTSPQPNWALGYVNRTHAALSEFQLNTIFPFARPLDWVENKTWQGMPLIESAPESWLSSQPASILPLKTQHAQNGPFSLGWVFSRTTDKNDKLEQRIIVVGNGEFLANQYIGNAGNLELGLQLIQWLATSQAEITIPPRPSLDHALRFSQRSLTAMAYGFLVLLPLGLIVIGVIRVWRRRRN